MYAPIEQQILGSSLAAAHCSARGALSFVRWPTHLPTRLSLRLRGWFSRVLRAHSRTKHTRRVALGRPHSPRHFPALQRLISSLVRAYSTRAVQDVVNRIHHCHFNKHQRVTLRPLSTTTASLQTRNQFVLWCACFVFFQCGCKVRGARVGCRSHNHVSKGV